jgi:hypothetical protein
MNGSGTHQPDVHRHRASRTRMDSPSPTRSCEVHNILSQDVNGGTALPSPNRNGTQGTCNGHQPQPHGRDYAHPMPSLTSLPLPPLAVIGMSFRFPEEAVSASGFWDLLLSARCVSKPTPPDRFNVAAHHHPDKDRLETVSYDGGHFLADPVDEFDAPFFSIGAVEAQAMDPVHRLVLETAYRALENAGLPLDRVSGSRTAVFSGCSNPDYATMLHKDPCNIAKYHATGTSNNMHANRVSWFFNFCGPSAGVDTACSSSLMALDLACQSIWAGDSEMVRVFLPLRSFVQISLGLQRGIDSAVSG